MFFKSRRKNRDRRLRYLTVVRRADSSAIVSPGGIIVPVGIFGRSYLLSENELESYLAWESQYRKRAFLLSWPIGIVFILILILLMVAAPEYDVLILFVGTGGLIFFIVQWATRSFRTRFPDAPRVRDSGKWQRFTLVMLATMPRWFCVFVFIFFSVLAVVPLAGAISGSNVFDPMGDVIVTSLGHYSFLLYLGYLTVEHFRFRRRHGRGPRIEDFGPPI
jgi:hypothetical protein